MDRRQRWFLGTAIGTLIAGSFWSSAPSVTNLSVSFAGWCFLLLPAALALGFVRTPKTAGVAAGLIVGGIVSFALEGSAAGGLDKGVIAAGLLALAIRYGLGALMHVESQAETTRVTAAV